MQLQLQSFWGLPPKCCSPPSFGGTTGHFLACPANLQLLPLRHPIPPERRRPFALRRCATSVLRWLDSGAAPSGAHCSCCASSPQLRSLERRISAGFSPAPQHSQQCRCRCRRSPQRSLLDRRKLPSSCTHCNAGAASPSDAGGGRTDSGTQDASPEDASPQPAAASTPDLSAAQPPKARFLEVPWGGEMVMQVMVLWLVAFWLLGCFVVPIALDLAGLEREDLSSRGHALVHLLLDLSETGVTLAILWKCLGAFRPLALGWFPLALRPLRRWLLPVLASCVAFPGVDWVASQSQVIFPADGELWGANLMEHSLAAGDPVTNVLYFAVVSICAPIWEEAIFRGFLLPSLAKWMPVPGAVLASSLIFAAAHFSMQRFAPLLLLGIIIGTLFVRTRNLVTSVALHSLWNMWVFWQVCSRTGVVI